MQASEGAPAKPLVYSDRIVAYLDLLGFTNLVRNGPAHDALAALEQVRQTQQRAAITKSENPEWFDFSIFSDSIAISIDLRNGDPEIALELRAWVLVNFVRSVYLAQLEAGILVRGAIIRGDLYHQDPVVFGPALVAAHDDEARAVYPRVLVDAGVVELASSSSAAKSFAPPETMFKQDKDGTFAIRMFAPQAKLTTELGRARDIFYPRYHAVAQHLYETAPDRKVRQKLAWLIADIKEDEEKFGDLVSRKHDKQI